MFQRWKKRAEGLQVTIVDKSGVKGVAAYLDGAKFFVGIGLPEISDREASAKGEISPPVGVGVEGSYGRKQRTRWWTWVGNIPGLAQLDEAELRQAVAGTITADSAGTTYVPQSDIAIMTKVRAEPSLEEIQKLVRENPPTSVESLKRVLQDMVEKGVVTKIEKDGKSIYARAGFRTRSARKYKVQRKLRKVRHREGN